MRYTFRLLSVATLAIIMNFAMAEANEDFLNLVKSISTLTKEQGQQIDNIIIAGQQRSKQDRLNLRAVRQKIGDLTRSGEVNVSPEFEQLLAQEVRLMANIHRARRSTMFEIKRTLSPSQLSEFSGRGAALKANKENLKQIIPPSNN